VIQTVDHMLRNSLNQCQFQNFVKESNQLYDDVFYNLAMSLPNNNNNNNNVISVIIGTTGTISKSFRTYVSNIPGKHEVKELQKTAILDTAHIIRKVLM